MLDRFLDCGMLFGKLDLIPSDEANGIDDDEDDALSSKGCTDLHLSLILLSSVLEFNIVC